MEAQYPQLERFPLLGRGLAGIRFHTPRDADWLPRNWESDVYPKGGKRSDNIVAILQWLDWQIWYYKERLIPLLDDPEARIEDPGDMDRGGPVRDAYRLVEQFREKRGRVPSTPVERGREYRHNRDDLQAVVQELVKVREWFNECAQRGLKRPGQGKKRSTEKGEARVKIISELTRHHDYQKGSCLNLEPIGNNELARKVGVDKATASAFFKKEFKGYVKYRAACGDATRLVAALKLLNQEFEPHLLYGGKPPGEDEHEDE